MEPGWDKEFAAKLREQVSITAEVIMQVVGLVAEERMKADRIGYQRGFNDGHADGYKKAVQQDTGANSRHLDRGTY